MKKGFSLIELLISVIIISVITAALAPIMTKKVKGNLLILNNGVQNGSSNITEDGKTLGGDDDNEYLDPACVDGPNPTCCENLNAIYISSQTHPGYSGKPICMTKFNVGDELFGTQNNYYNPPYAKFGVQMIYPYVKNIHDAKCVMTDMNKNTCCWKGTTSTTAATSGNNISSKGYPVSYGGLERTVCQKEAAELLCDNWARGGSYKGSWRLPTQAELAVLANYIALDTATEADEGHVNLSKWAGKNGLQLCDASANVKTKSQKIYQSSDYCPNATTCQGALNNQCTPSQIWSSGDPYVLSQGVFKAATLANNATAGVRCVSEHPGVRIKTPVSHTPQGTEPKSQEDCDKYGALFIDAKYLSASGDGKNLCMLQYSTEPVASEGKYNFDYISSGVSLLDAGQSCKLTDGSCCWYKGTGVTGGNWNYSGSNRAVCQWQAAKNLCENYQPTDGVTKTGKWRLPTNTELNALAMYLMASSEYSPFISKYLDDGSTGGIQLCDSASYLFGSNTCKVTAKCVSAPENQCKPWLIWTSDADGTANHYAFSLLNGVFRQVSISNKTPISVRCVTDSIEGEVPKPYEPDANEPQSQEDCDAFNAVFVEQKYTKTKNLCITKYNPSDAEDDMPYDFVAAKVQLMKVNQNCIEKGQCCWQGKTSTGTISTNGGSYSPNNRTMCQRKAGASLCSTYKPNPYNQNSEHYGSWRLPTDSELTNMINAISSGGQDFPGLTKYAQDSGLMLCDQASNTYGSHKCPYFTACKGGKGWEVSTSDSSATYNCFPYKLWSDDYTYSLNTGRFLRDSDNFSNGSYDQYAASVRCVSSNVKQKYTDTKYTPKDSNEPQNQSDCTDSALFIPQKYTGTTNLCMAKGNFADLNPKYIKFTIGNNSPEDYANIGITMTESQKACPAAEAAQSLCCWRGATAAASAGTYSYPSSQRTVCQYEAAKKLCESIGWRLMTQSEATMFSYAMNATSEGGNIILSRYEDDSLQLCDYTTNAWGSNQCTPIANCKSALGNCLPSDIWHQAGAYRLNNGIFLSAYLIATTNNKKNAASVRCVTNQKVN